MRRWGLVIALLLSLGVNIGLLATAALVRLRPAAARPAAQAPRARVERLAGRLGLEGEARRRFIARQIQFFDESSGLRADLEEIHRDLRREITRPKPDPQKVNSLLQESEQTYHQLEQAMIDHVLDSRAMLDPAQERRFVDFVRRMRAGPFGAPGRARAQRQRRRGGGAEDRPLPGGAPQPADAPPAP